MINPLAVLGLAALTAASTAVAQPCEPHWAAGLFGPQGAFDRVRTAAVFDDGEGLALYIGGDFTIAGGVPAQYIAKWDGQEFSPVGSGMNDAVNVLVVYDDDGEGPNPPALYAGGRFTNAGGQSAARIAKWDGQSWSALGSGVSDQVQAMVVFDAGTGSRLCVGGQFSTAGGMSVSNLARWDGASWSGTGGGTNGQIDTLAVYDDGAGPALVAGGSFTTAGGAPASRIARWDGAAWSPLGSGTDQSVSSVVAIGTDLYAAGEFANAGGTPASSIAMWDGLAWSALPPPAGPASFRRLASFDAGGGAVLVGAGSIQLPGGSRHIASFDGVSWSGLGAGISSTGTIDAVIAVDAGDGPGVIVCGQFAAAGNVRAENIARWDGQGWSVFGGGLDGTTRELAVHNDGSGPAVYASGVFSTAGTVGANGIAKWNGGAWSALGSGLTSNNGVESAYALLSAADDGGPVLYAGGTFTAAGGVAAPYVASWRSGQWSALGAGTNGRVLALAAFDPGGGQRIYAGGEFSQAGGNAAARIAGWDGTAWSAVGNVQGERVSSLAVYDDGAGPALYAGGYFDSINGLTLRGIGRWDGATWSALGAGVDQSWAYINALKVAPEGGGAVLLAGGRFDSIDGVPARCLARWDGTAWSAVNPPLPAGDTEIFDLAVVDDGGGPALFVAGYFGGGSGGILKLEDGEWTPVGGGVLGTVYAIANIYSVDARQNTIYAAGGSFGYAGGVLSNNVAAWVGCPLPIIPSCPADWNNDTTVNSTDISAFLTAWLDSVQNGNLSADFNGDMAVNSGDISTFLTAWLDAVQNGC